ncbi:MAG: hypothetical protein WBQ94_04380 [Terracidiphilus sp.]
MSKKAKGDYLTPLSAIARLMQLSVEWLAACKEGVKVKWSIRIDYQAPDGNWIQTRTFGSGLVDTSEEMMPPTEEAEKISV